MSFITFGTVDYLSASTGLWKPGKWHIICNVLAMEEPGFIVVFVTASSREEADKIASILLESRKAACVNIIPQVSSRFWWHGKIDSGEEVLLVIKTKGSAMPEIIDMVQTNHSYSVPEIIAMPIVSGNPDYLKWINSEVTG